MTAARLIERVRAELARRDAETRGRGVRRHGARNAERRRSEQPCSRPAAGHGGAAITATPDQKEARP